MTALISELQKYEAIQFINLCKSIYNNKLQQSIYLCHKRTMSQIWQVTHFGRAEVKGHTMIHTYPPNQCP